MGLPNVEAFNSDKLFMTGNTRLRWTIKPGNDLFVVCNWGWQRIVTDPHLSLIPQSDLIAVKLRWTFRL
jgi:hypothetical protein